MDKKPELTHIKEYVPLITTQREKAEFKTLNPARSQIKNEELFYRVQQR